jgi:hypothetical protein
MPALRVTLCCQSPYGIPYTPRPTSSFPMDEYVERLLIPVPSRSKKSRVPLPRSTLQRQDCNGGVDAPPRPATLFKVPLDLIRSGPGSRVWMTTIRLLPLSTRPPVSPPQGQLFLMHHFPATDHATAGLSAHVAPSVEMCS